MLLNRQTGAKHFKLYKSGKRWMVAAIALVSFNTGVLGLTNTAKADENSTNTPTSTVSYVKTTARTMASTSAGSATLSGATSAPSVANSISTNSTSVVTVGTSAANSETSINSIASNSNLTMKTPETLSASGSTASQAPSLTAKSPNSVAQSVVSNASQTNVIQAGDSVAVRQNTDESTASSDSLKTGVSDNVSQMQQTDASQVQHTKTDADASATETPVMHISSTRGVIKVGGTAQVDAWETPEGSQTGPTQFVSDNQNVATVSSTGLITGIAPGKATIEVTIPLSGSTQSMNLLVQVASANNFLVNAYLAANSSSLEVGQSEPMKMILTPVDLIHQQPTWTSSDPAVLSVDAEGNVTALKLGTASIQAKLVDGAGTQWTLSPYTIVVAPKNANEITSIAMSFPKSYLQVGEEEQGTYSVSPDPTWQLGSHKWTSSDPNVVTVDEQTGHLVAVGEGESTISFTGFKYDGHGWITSRLMHVYNADEKFENGKVNWPKNLKTGLSGTAVLTTNIANNKLASAQWQSSDPNVATVDQNGNISALSAGSVTIFVDVHGYNGVGITYSNVYDITASVPLSGAQLIVPKSILGIGDNEVLTLTLLPTNADLHGQTKWTSSDEKVLVVDRNGYVKAIGAGSAFITTVSTDNFGKSYIGKGAIQVLTPKSVTALTISGVRTLNINKQGQLSTNIQDEQDGYRSVSWTSSDPSILSIDANGNMTSHLPGTVTITVNVVDAFGKTVETQEKVTSQLNLPATFEAQRLALNNTILNFNKTLQSVGVNYSQLTPFSESRWAKNALTYSVINPTQIFHASDGDISAEQIWNAAALAWNNELKALGSNITLTEVTTGADITGEIVTNDQLGKVMNVTDASKTAGLCQASSENNMQISGQVHTFLNDDLSESVYAYTKAEAVVVEEHEIGHALGLWHSSNANSVMFFKGTATQELEPFDVLGAILASKLPSGLNSHIIGLDDYSNGVDNV